MIREEERATELKAGMTDMIKKEKGEMGRRNEKKR